ncbi:hypothetical protein TEA_022634 [Camellia sinensis var. sinensis]|uniref:Major facilitator superfamily (MFS) profile domain-containing protein n=1 Tax=Camellia sinensis var. sinensis TaxID=542762 RepID=A0A4S4DN67_CAMSN|nr:hypothetical protein TEA_022634 [Camellia sinensis var. sinensis]
MVTKKDEERGRDSLQEENREPLLQDQEQTLADRKDEHEWMVYFSTFVAVCGSYSFGTCVGYSSPVQSAITEDLNLSIAEDKTGSSVRILPSQDTFTARQDFMLLWKNPKVMMCHVKCKQAMRTSSAFCVAGWLAIYFAKGSLALDIGRVATGYGMGVFSYVAKVGQRKEFEAALQELRGKDADTSQEAAEIQIAVGLMVCQQLGGINGVCFYVTSIFESAGFPSNVGTIIYACLQVSASGLVLGSALTAIAFYLKTYEIALKASPIFAVTGILIYVGSFSIGMGAVPWVIMSEIFPINVKGIAGSLATLVNWIMAWVASYTFNYLMSWSSYGTFILYGAVNAIAIVFVVKMVPETKGRTLEQIQAAING